MLLHACLLLNGRVFQHLRAGREYMKRRQDGQHGNFDADLFGQGEPMLNSHPGEFRSVSCYQDVGIHCPSQRFPRLEDFLVCIACVLAFGAAGFGALDARGAASPASMYALLISQRRTPA
jgi:hypothetical protein